MHFVRYYTLHVTCKTEAPFRNINKQTNTHTHTHTHTHNVSVSIRVILFQILPTRFLPFFLVCKKYVFTAFLKSCLWAFPHNFIPILNFRRYSQVFYREAALKNFVKPRAFFNKIVECRVLHIGVLNFSWHLFIPAVFASHIIRYWTTATPIQQAIFYMSSIAPLLLLVSRRVNCNLWEKKGERCLIDS